jgi:hypothetical protein
LAPELHEKTPETSLSDATWRHGRHLDRTLQPEEEPMTSRDSTTAPTGSQPIASPQSAGAIDSDRSPAMEDEGPIEIELDFIDEALEESMIASDPPALTPETAIGPPGHGADKSKDKDGSRRD